MTTVGFIGSGAIGSTIARLAVEAGHQVVLSNSRGPETLTDTVTELGPRASAATSGQAAAASDIVVVTVPVKAFPDLPAAPLAGKTVIDTCNYGPERDGPIPELDGKSLSSSKLLLRYLPDAMVVKAFNNIFFKHLLSLARPTWAGDRSYLPIAGRGITQWLAKFARVSYESLKQRHRGFRLRHEAIVRCIQRSHSARRGQQMALTIRVGQTRGELSEDWRLAGIQFSSLGNKQPRTHWPTPESSSVADRAHRRRSAHHPS
ncbi:putative dinucleotide-binding enzyme [Micromonospora pisi]|uniref:Putative dinucleotide-binding enzyme n=1 Tax=Micromonospora pisi TaxID=589240 RepID=A0A495JS06_9ACTN|nr:NAD(P)-binding domain-containing protein [Micromonospora pisi]RKR91405.1 putative dinucleotide-binding enzyme [Micromonospora pisi]